MFSRINGTPTSKGTQIITVQEAFLSRTHKVAFASHDTFTIHSRKNARLIVCSIAFEAVVQIYNDQTYQRDK
jgi:hypothetical protein